MPTHVARLSVRRATIIVGVVALMLAGAVHVRRQLILTPAEWALHRAESCEQSAKTCRDMNAKPHGSLGNLLEMAHRSLQMAGRYRRLAEGYESEGAAWAEQTGSAPYDDRLTTGETVATMLPAQGGLVKKAGVQGGAGSGVITARTVCVVSKDPAWEVDDDGCFPGRLIEARVVDGPHTGVTVTIERAIVRRVRR